MKILRLASRSLLSFYIILAVIKAFGNISIAYISGLMIDTALKKNSKFQEIFLIAVLGIIALLIILISNIFFQYLKSDIVKNINVELKKRVFNYLVYVGKETYKNELSLVTNDLKQIETQITLNYLLIISDVCSFVFALLIGLANSWILTVIFSITTIIPSIVQTHFTKRIQKTAKSWEKSNSEYTQSASDTINGTETSRLYNTQSTLISYVMKPIKELESNLKEMSFSQNSAYEIIAFVAEIMGFVIPFLIGSLLILSGQLQVGILIMIVQLSNQFINPMIDIYNRINQIKSNEPIYRKIEPALNYTNKHEEDASKPNKFETLTVSHLFYSYSNTPVINDLNLKIKNNEKILFIAPSGWGKTTFLKLLMGILKPLDGDIVVDKLNITSNFEKSHNYFSYINQRPFIFDANLRFNITLGRSVSNEFLNKVIRAAGLEKLIKEKGWDYQVGENGKKLSGGQIQRIEIARALLANRPILLADEATSSLDNKLSLAIHKIILNSPGLTVIEVAHKITDQEKKMFDRVIDLNNKQ